MAVYYNDADPAVCTWLRDLIAAGLLPPGEVDERSILDVVPADLRGFAQCHFFAGIGGWPYALRLAGVAEDLPVWTGSPPCQPFSQAGQHKGQDDDRHLAPAFLRLVAACRPELVFGEQVASAAVLGRVGTASRKPADGPAGWAWFDALAADLEAASYAVAAADLPAAGIGAPHIRQRLFFGAIALEPGGLGDGLGARSQGRIGMPGRSDQRAARPAGLAGGLADGDGGLARDGEIQRGREHGCKPQDGEPGRLVEGDNPAGTDATDSVWRDADWLRCRDGRWRPVEPASQRMANGLSLCLGSMRAKGIGQETETLGAEKAIGFGREVLRAMRGGHAPEAVWLSLGGRLGFPTATFLFSLMCQHSRQLGIFCDSAATGGAQDGEAFMRALRREASSASRSSQGPELVEQLAGELGDAVSALSSDCAHHKQLMTELASYTSGPLEPASNARVGRLRGYGNAIVPPLAAEFVTAFLESL